jgi:hypothetical protein
MTATTKQNSSKNPLPSHVNPLGIQFQVQLVDQIDEDGSSGEMSGIFRIIKVWNGQDSRRQWTTLLHEYVHATLDVMGAGSILEPDVEEMIVQSLEHSMEQFLLAHGKQILKALESLANDNTV